MEITSPQNPKIKALKKLDKASERREHGLFLIEGLRELCLADKAGYEIAQLFVCEDLLHETERYNLQSCTLKNTEHYTITRQVYEAVAYRETTEGIIATARPRSHSLDALQLSDTPLILVIEGVEKPGNLGAMLRTADATVVDAVILCDTKTDLYNPNVVRSSLGTVFTHQIAIEETSQVIAYLHSLGITTFAAELTATMPHWKARFEMGTAIVVGTEATGLSQQWIEAANVHVKIPMLGSIDSLNVSVSAAVLLYEAVRQRVSSKS